MLAPATRPRWSAGNVETSQAVTGALYAALGVQAEGSGTMNNVTFGNDRYQYYETVASGSGAGRRLRRHRRGADPHDQLPADRPRGAGVALPGAARELRDPRAAAAARAAGAAATAAVRRLRFLEPMTVTTLSQPPPRRRRTAWPAAQPGALGRQWIEHADGTVTRWRAATRCSVEAGDVFVVETPGGGGYGPAGAGLPDDHPV